MAQWLTGIRCSSREPRFDFWAFAVLPGNPGLISSINMVAQKSLASISGEPMPSSGLHWQQTCRWWTATHAGKTPKPLNSRIVNRIVTLLLQIPLPLSHPGPPAHVLVHNRPSLSPCKHAASWALALAIACLSIVVVQKCLKDKGVY